MISIILPTYNEADNIKVIVPMLSNVLEGLNTPYEIIIVDDNSPDGTGNIAHGLSEKYPVAVDIRKDEKGLSSAVIKGFKLARGDVFLVMDADLSHPVHKIPEMVRPILENKCDMTVGSRYIKGGAWEKQLFVREIISRTACFLARGITHLSDPTSGFMAVKKNILKGLQLDPLGWKIVLEIAVKAHPKIRDIPITFGERAAGESKLGLKAEIDYIRHLWRLYKYKFLKIT